MMGVLKRRKSEQGIRLADMALMVCRVGHWLGAVMIAAMMRMMRTSFESKQR
jgi:hypothetical protein